MVNCFFLLLLSFLPFVMAEQQSDHSSEANVSDGFTFVTYKGKGKGKGKGAKRPPTVSMICSLFFPTRL